MIHAVKILLIWLLCLLSVLLHELGHASGYRLGAGKEGWKVIAGSGPEIVRGSKAAFRLIPMGGWFIPGDEPETDRGKIVMLAGGPAVSLLLTLLYGIARFCLLRSTQPESGLFAILFPASNFLFHFNFFQFFLTAVPIRYRLVCRGSESDGLQIVHILKRKSAEHKAALSGQARQIRDPEESPADGREKCADTEGPR